MKTKKKESFAVFSPKVPLKDYHCFVEFDMFFDLVLDRIKFQWYRSVDQMQLDIY